MITVTNEKIKEEFIGEFKELIKTLPSFRFRGNPIKINNEYSISYTIDSNILNKWWQNLLFWR